MREREERNACGFLVKFLAVIGAVAVIAGIVYAVYRHFSPDYLEDMEDDFDDYFENEDEEEKKEDTPLDDFKEESGEKTEAEAETEE